MSEELNAGVKIFLERCKSNPEEIMGHKWLGVVEAVFNYKETRQRNPYLRGLTEQEIDLIYEALNGLYRAKFDSYIMANVLNAEEPQQREFVYAASQGKQRLQGSTLLKPGGIYETVAVQTSNTPVTVPDRIKKFTGL